MIISVTVNQSIEIAHLRGYRPEITRVAIRTRSSCSSATDRLSPSTGDYSAASRAVAISATTGQWFASRTRGNGNPAVRPEERDVRPLSFTTVYIRALFSWRFFINCFFKNFHSTIIRFFTLLLLTRLFTLFFL